MAKSTSLAEAMLEAKEMKALMKTNVEKALLENLQPRITQLVSKNLQEMDDEYEQEEENDMDETLDISTLMQEVGEEADAPDLDGEMGDEMGQDDGDEDAEVSIGDMTPEAFKEMIKDAITAILGDEQAGEIDSTDMDTDEPPMDDVDAPEGEEEDDKMDEDLTNIFNEIMKDMGEDCDKEKDESLQESVKSLKKENADLKKAVAVYKKALNESKLALVQLSYVNGLIVESKLSNEQIIRFTEIIEKTKTVQEAKNVYDAINESVKTKSPKQVIKTQKIKESYGLNSNPILPNKSKVQTEDPFVTRMRRNAGLK